MLGSSPCTDYGQQYKNKFNTLCNFLQEAVAVGRSFASIKGYNLDGNKEMLAMGFMNVAGSMSSCYVTTGNYIYNSFYGH